MIAIPLAQDVGADGAAEACGESGGAACRAVYRATENEALADAVDVLVATPLKIAFVVILALIAQRLANRAINRFVRRAGEPPGEYGLRRLRQRAPGVLLEPPPVQARAAQRAETIGAVLRSIAGLSIWIMAVLVILGELEINIGPLIAGAGIAGVALGFGAQSLVKDFLSGMFMVMEDQFGVGDVIDAGVASGVVEGVSLRTTRLRDIEGTLWHVPNGEIRRVGNKSQEWSRAVLDVEVAYDTDLDLAHGIIKRVADEVWHDDDLGDSILDEPEIWGVEAVRAGGVAIRLVVKTRPADQWTILRVLRRRIKDAFDASGIAIPWAQQAAWVQGGAGPQPTEPAAKPPPTPTA